LGRGGTKTDGDSQKQKRKNWNPETLNSTHMASLVDNLDTSEHADGVRMAEPVVNTCHM
jgi:hypothetical protein